MPPDSAWTKNWPSSLPNVLLVGAGVVGRAIAEAHLVRGISFCIADQDTQAIDTLEQVLAGREIAVQRVTSESSRFDGLTVTRVGEVTDNDAQRPPIVIESIVERVDAKRALFQSLQRHFGRAMVLCSNTSTLQLTTIAQEGLPWPERVCGMHFFMPVHARPAVEIVAGQQTDADVLSAAVAHAARLGKQPIRCNDGPGFIVNRMLSPYLNQSLWLLCRGATEDQIARAARAYGMPLSPLELIDWIGTPTMYHAGKAFWSAFPQRIEPSPVVPALLKRKRLGRASVAGLYDYDNGIRSENLATPTLDLVETYRKDPRVFSDGEVLELLAIPMWIEATKLIDQGVADSLATVDQAMAGGLGYHSDIPWSAFFSELGPDRIQDAIARHSEQWKSMRVASY